MRHLLLGEQSQAPGLVWITDSTSSQVQGAGSRGEDAQPRREGLPAASAAPSILSPGLHVQLQRTIPSLPSFSVSNMGNNGASDCSPATDAGCSQRAQEASFPITSNRSVTRTHSPKPGTGHTPRTGTVPPSSVPGGNEPVSRSREESTSGDSLWDGEAWW